MYNLDYYINLEILTFLPIDDLLSMRLVDRYYFDMINEDCNGCLWNVHLKDFPSISNPKVTWLGLVYKFYDYKSLSIVPPKFGTSSNHEVFIKLDNPGRTIARCFKFTKTTGALFINVSLSIVNYHYCKFRMTGSYATFEHARIFKGHDLHDIAAQTMTVIMNVARGYIYIICHRNIEHESCVFMQDIDQANYLSVLSDSSNIEVSIPSEETVERIDDIMHKKMIGLDRMRSLFNPIIHK